MTRLLGSLVFAVILPVAAQPHQVTADTLRVEKLLLEDGNEFRGENRRKALAPDPRLDAAARKFADYMARTGHYGHQADGRTPGERLRAEGYRWCRVAENIAYAFDSHGFHSPDLAYKFIEGWKASPGHRRNLLDPEVTAIGVAVARDRRNYYYAVQLFARPCSG